MNLDKVLIIVLIVILSVGWIPLAGCYAVWRLRKNWDSVARVSGDRALDVLADWAFYVALGAWVALLVGYVVPFVRVLGSLGFLVWPYLALSAERNVARRGAAGPGYWRPLLGVLLTLQGGGAAIAALGTLAGALGIAGPFAGAVGVSAWSGLEYLVIAVALLIPGVGLLRLRSAPMAPAPAVTPAEDDASAGATDPPSR